MTETTSTKNLSSFAWSIAEILRGNFKQSDYGKVILPFVVLRRLDCIWRHAVTHDASYPDQISRWLP